MIDTPPGACGGPATPARNPLGPKYTAPNPIDIHVGGRLRQRRTLLGMSQEKLGDLLGLTFQQIQKYERGTNRIGASRLYELSVILQVPVGHFFDGAPSLSGKDAFGVAEDADYDDPMMRRETLELIRSYYQIRDVAVRRRILDLTRSLAGHGDDDDDSHADDGNTPA
ncbi:helix-turn-helix transcriptional regulator [Fodinicurvata sp. EGI_FJ10296]|uniref:helix-turn-helix domain-containing protein n=1 Tax=Fodinicurvata sp. EGI_FJ10296 TaxID=3231908 RepID=UPI003455FC83